MSNDKKNVSNQPKVRMDNLIDGMNFQRYAQIKEFIDNLKMAVPRTDLKTSVLQVFCFYKDSQGNTPYRLYKLIPNCQDVIHRALNKRFEISKEEIVAFRDDNDNPEGLKKAKNLFKKLNLTVQ